MCNKDGTTGLAEMRPILLVQVTPARETAYIQCGWTGGNTAFRSVMAVVSLLVCGAGLLNVFKLKGDKVHYAFTALGALVTLLFLVVVIVDANALRSVSDYYVCKGQATVKDTTYECHQAKVPPILFVSLPLTLLS